MVGVILSGGQSARMGSDKGLLKNSRKEAWVEHAVSLLDEFCTQVVVSVNPSQSAIYSKLFSPDQLVIDNTNIPVRGPLLGLLSAHETFPGRTIFLLACDMIYMDAHVLSRLYSIYLQQGDKEVYIYENEGRLEPLCGIYSRPGLNHLSNYFMEHKREKSSMMHALDQLAVHTIPVPESWRHFFSNINTREDLTHG